MLTKLRRHVRRRSYYEEGEEGRQIEDIDENSFNDVDDEDDNEGDVGAPEVEVDITGMSEEDAEDARRRVEIDKILAMAEMMEQQQVSVSPRPWRKRPQPVNALSKRRSRLP